ncbi:MAG: PQQ-binding-like beta-propeller repeat protein [Verrucomicrobiales bacterium]|nr:PQQ-binding-like beta-propeller repeat protein [Verrucomicrobiales bacterium]
MKLILKLSCLFAMMASLLLLVSCDKNSTPDEPPAPEANEAPPAVESPAPAEAGGEKADPSPAPAPQDKPAENADAGSTAPGGGDWKQWGRDGTNNMMSPATSIPSDFTAGEMGEGGKVEGAKHARWVVQMGSQAYGTATVADGRVFIGTNNEEPRLPGVKGDHGVVMAFDEKSGEFLWQFSIPKLGAGKVSDWEFLGVCSSIALDGKYGYVITNRGEVICLDLYGMSDGNDGPFQDEGKYMKGGLEKMDEVSEPAEVGEKDADIVWGYDIRSQLGVFPHNITSSSVTIAGDYVYASTSNGVDWSHINIPNTLSPCLVALNKETGELAAEEASGISERIMHCNWSSPAFAPDLAGKPTVVFGAGDGWTYGYHATEFDKEEDGGETFHLLKELWKVDCCPKEYRFDESGEPIKYATYPGPSEIISSPVIYNGKVYSCIGQDPEHGEGVGAVTCIDPSKGTGEEAVVWQFKEVGRTISTPSIVDGLLYIADYSGKLFCLDAETGEKYWEHDTLSHIWGSTLVVDGKVFLGNEDGEMIILKAGKEKEEIATVEYPAPIYSTPVVANGTLYVMTQTHLYAYEGKQ